MVFYEITRNAVREAVGSAARVVARARQRAAGAPRARLPGRLQPLAALVEEGAPRTLRRTRAEPGAAHDLRARGGDRRLQGRRSTGPSRAKAHTARRPSRSSCSSIAARRSSSSASPTRRRRARSSAPSRPRPARAPRCGHAARHRHRPQAAAPQPGAAVHHLDAAAGGSAQARIQRAPHHAPRAAAVRGLDIGEGSVGLITYMRTDSVSLAARSDAGDPRGRGPAIRQGRSRRGAAHLQDQVEERAGSARSHPPDLRRDHARADIEGKIEDDLYPAVYAHLEARRRLADEPRGLRHRRGRHARRQPTGRAAPAPRQRLDPGEAGLYLGLPGRYRRCEERRYRPRAAADERG